MATHKIGLMAGDGIGPEVITEGLKVIEAAGVNIETVDYDLGGERYLRDGTVLPDSVVDEWRELDAIYVGAVGTPDVPPGVLERGLLLRMRFELDLYINLRPFRLPERNIDMAVIRENTEGAYAGEGGFLRKGTPHEIVTQGSVNTRMGVERAIRFGFELASGRRRHVTLVHKTNVMTYSGDLWYRTFEEVAAEYPDHGTAYNHVDAACIYFVDSPDRYDVIVTDNLFGDILTDLGGAVSGGIGKAASANLNAAGTGPSMFEPVHGSAPDIAGQGIADPSAAILSAAMMLEHLGEAAAAASVDRACMAVDGSVAGTSAIGDAIAAAVAGSV
jgi:3-isopropylmalate dehydrogenase